MGLIEVWCDCWARGSAGWPQRQECEPNRDPTHDAVATDAGLAWIHFMFCYGFLFTTYILDEDGEVDLMRTTETTTHYKQLQDLQEDLWPKTLSPNVKSAMDKLAEAFVFLYCEPS